MTDSTQFDADDGFHGHGDARTERVAFGFWLFLMSDLIIFGLFFSTYVVMQPARAGGPGPAELFDLTSVALQTAFLLLSSLACGYAMLAFKYSVDVRRTVFWMLVSGGFAALFLFLELRDFAHMATHGGLPWNSAYLGALWSLIGLHGLHVTAGLIWLLVLVAQLLKHGHDDRLRPGLLSWSLYWHFLDLMWIGIFSIVFLAGLA